MAFCKSRFCSYTSWFCVFCVYRLATVSFPEICSYLKTRRCSFQSGSNTKTRKKHLPYRLFYTRYFLTVVKTYYGDILKILPFSSTMRKVILYNLSLSFWFLHWPSIFFLRITSLFRCVINCIKIHLLKTWSLKSQNQAKTMSHSQTDIKNAIKR